MNHSLDKSVQMFTQFDGYIQLKDDDELVIMLKKPSNKRQHRDFGPKTMDNPNVAKDTDVKKNQSMVHYII